MGVSGRKRQALENGVKGGAGGLFASIPMNGGFLGGHGIELALTVVGSLYFTLLSDAHDILPLRVLII